MPETDVLNSTPTDPLNPDYGWQKKRPVTHLVGKANVGPSYTREITDVGHQFLLSWGTTLDSQKAESDILRLKRYYEQYRDGFFTLIDQEGATKREFVGRFVTPVEPIPIGHNRWAAQNVLFEEVPDAPMRTGHYPSDWTNDSIWRFTMNDFGEVQPAVDDPASWHFEGSDGGPSYYQLVSTETDAYAQLTYLGWGCQVYGVIGPGLGIAEILLDGDSQGTVDQYNVTEDFTGVLLMTITDVPLGLHTLRMRVTGTKNGASSGYGCIFYALKVMR
jgi:hypothetical protein